MIAILMVCAAVPMPQEVDVVSGPEILAPGSLARVRIAAQRVTWQFATPRGLDHIEMTEDGGKLIVFAIPCKAKEIVIEGAYDDGESLHLFRHVITVDCDGPGCGPTEPHAEFRENWRKATADLPDRIQAARGIDQTLARLKPRASNDDLKAALAGMMNTIPVSSRNRWKPAYDTMNAYLAKRNVRTGAEIIPILRVALEELRK